MKILITGASRGLGLALAVCALENGHEVAATYRGKRSSELNSLKEIYGHTLLLLDMDVQEGSTVVQAAAEVKRTWGCLNAIINNAAVLLGRAGFIDTVRIEDIETSMDVNVYGVIRVLQAFLPIIEEHAGSCILNISSESASLNGTREDDYPYCISKAALNVISEKLRLCLAPKEIRVLAVHPGWMRTDMGGKEAQEDPIAVAERLLKMVTGEVKLDAVPAFVDQYGAPMPL